MGFMRRLSRKPTVSQKLKRSIMRLWPAMCLLFKRPSGGAGGRVFNTAGGQTVAIVGAAPKRVAINEWDSLDQLQAFYKSKAWTDLAPQRDKAVKTIRIF